MIAACIIETNDLDYIIDNSKNQVLGVRAGFPLQSFCPTTISLREREQKGFSLRSLTQTLANLTYIFHNIKPLSDFCSCILNRTWVNKQKGCFNYFEAAL
ncbi:MAG: hypothetical protein JWN56_651 [Sphingobacteriales bacterium]|nr:hypothetical protein [Sphingobacteriales bacterium]